jgi:hypothetical protein
MSSNPPNLYGGVPTGAIVNIILPNAEKQRLLNEERSREGWRLEALRCKEIRRKEEEQREREEYYRKYPPVKSEYEIKMEQSLLASRLRIEQERYKKRDDAISKYKSNYDNFVKSMNSEISNLKGEVYSHHKQIMNKKIKQLGPYCSYEKEQKVKQKYRQIVDSKINSLAKPIYDKYKKLIMDEQEHRNIIVKQNVDFYYVDAWMSRLVEEDKKDMKIFPIIPDKKCCAIM